MNPREVKLWVGYHAELFTTFGDWLGKQPPGAKALAFNAWNKGLAKITVDDAKAASDAMVVGRVDKPFNPEDHVKAIIRAAAKLAAERRQANRPRRIDGHDTVACPVCQDSGVVECYDPDYLKSVRAGKPGYPYRLAVLCTCASGDVRDKDRRIPRYDPERCCRFERKSADGAELAGVLAWIAAHPAPVQQQEAF